MMNINTILVPTDFSKNAEAGVRYAKDLSSVLDAEVILIHVSPYHPTMMVHGFGAVPIPRVLEDAVLQGVERGFADAKKIFDDTKHVRTVHVKGIAHSEIIDYAKSESVDMIVTSTHGHTGLTHLFVGSVAEKIVRLAPCPVLTVRPPKEPEA